MPLVKERVRALFRKALFPNNKCLAVADLGCSSGPNSLLAISWIIEAISGLCSQTGRSLPEVLVFLNDLPGNDFNSVFSSLPSFYENQKEKNGVESNCYISAMPGSFHGRLFPSRSLHFVHSSYSVHWLSQVPELPVQNKGSIYMASTSSPSIFEAYLKQFQRDFKNLLSSRAQEIVPGGEIFLTFMSRSIPDPTSKDCCLFWWWLSRSLVEMAEEDENCVFDKLKSGRNVTDCIRSVTEPILRSHFGEGLLMDDLFKRYARLVGDHLSVEKTKCFNIAVSMTRK
ncbi:hypothetical protein CRG98_042546 [Punica granatum]|uniref:Salicylate carboxymethyltransferase-like n=1 Tax=Punica granatum TaxID=22663 RepID=A0A2I0HZE2_PUNGR|nr:hypothetical protein CRG98_042546 [Punica granatum]